MEKVLLATLGSSEIQIKEELVKSNPAFKFGQITDTLFTLHPVLHPELAISLLTVYFSYIPIKIRLL